MPILTFKQAQPRLELVEPIMCPTLRFWGRTKTSYLISEDRFQLCLNFCSFVTCFWFVFYISASVLVSSLEVRMVFPSINHAPVTTWCISSVVADVLVHNISSDVLYSCLFFKEFFRNLMDLVYDIDISSHTRNSLI